jgi:subtilase family protein
MNKKRQSEPSRGPSPSFVKRLLGGFQELPPQIRLLVVGVAVVGIIFAILPKSLFNSFTCAVQNLPQNYRSSNGYYIDNQVIISGLESDINAIIETPPTATPTAPALPTTSIPPVTAVTFQALATPTTTGTPVVTLTAAPPGPSNKVILNPIEGCDLSYLKTRKVSDSNAPVETRKLVMRLYEVPNDSNVDTVISKIHQAKVITPSLSIWADPNYLTRLSDSTGEPCAHPSDPGSGGGHPIGDPGIPDPKTARDAFMKQWAFGPDGINLTAFRDSNPGLTGRGVRVGVFDTSPFRIPLPFFRRIGGALPSPLWFTNWDAGGTTMMSSHGLFVAELIHGIAPKSRIHLIRVLNDNGCGDLWTLNKGLHDFISHMSAWTGKLDKTVINMSLGFRVINNTEDNDTGTEQDVPKSPENDNLAEEETAATEQDAPDVMNEDVETLRSLLKTANDMGAIMFAAAGNTSDSARVEEMEVPASDPAVYGVAATNINGERSCYSNEGEVAAPGGDGGMEPPRPDGKPQMPCVGRSDTWNQTPPPKGSTVPCTDVGNCPFGLISLAQTRYGPQYVMWSGTSFATPLVSGLAALAYEKRRKPDVLNMIQLGATAQSTTTSDPDLGWGLINVVKSLNSPSYP